MTSKLPDPRPLSTRVLGFMDLDDGPQSEQKLRWLRRVVTTGFTADVLGLMGSEPSAQDAPGFTVAVVLVLATVASFVRRLERASSFAALAAILVWSARWFPETANHYYLLALLMALLCFVNPERQGERALALSFVRWFTCIFIAWTGIQKAWWGLYFDGSYLAYLTSDLENYQTALGWLFPDAEIERLADLDRSQADSGPYFVQCWGFIALANLIWILEIVQPVLLALPRTRKLGLLFGLAAMVGMQVFAREIVFGTVSITMMLLFASKERSRLLYPLWILLYVWMILTRHGLPPTPGMVFY